MHMFKYIRLYAFKEMPLQFGGKRIAFSINYAGFLNSHLKENWPLLCKIDENVFLMDYRPNS